MWSVWFVVSTHSLWFGRFQSGDSAPAPPAAFSTFRILESQSIPFILLQLKISAVLLPRLGPRLLSPPVSDHLHIVSSFNDLPEFLSAPFSIFRKSHAAMIRRSSFWGIMHSIEGAIHLRIAV
jgi:hypothetical protein